MDVPRDSIAQVFERRKQANAIALMPFVPAGFPDLEATAKVIGALAENGAAMIEIGFPFSDPVADGPIIQAAFTHALAKKQRVDDVLGMIRQVRGRVGLPLLAMVSYSIVFRYGTERFVQAAKSAGVDGLILPDLPPPEAQAVCQVIRRAGLDTVLLAAPSTPPDRRKQIADLSSGFVYYLSVAGTTGARADLPADLVENLRQLRKLTDKPLCVGFGVSRPEHVRQLKAVADGAIVGSALVQKLADHKDDPAAAAAVAGEFCGELARAAG